MKVSEESLTIRLPADLKISVEQFAADLDIGLSELGRLALDAFLRNPGAEKLAEKLQRKKDKRTKGVGGK